MRAWKVAVGAGLRIEPLGSGCVVFQPRTGNTHYLQEPASSVLIALLGEARTTVQVRNFLADTFDVSDQGGITGYADQMLQQLESLGLIE